MRIYKWINCFQSTFLKQNSERFTGIFGYWILDLWINKTNNLECITLGNYNQFSIFLTFCKLNYLLRCSCWQSNLSSCISRNENNLTGNSKKKRKRKKKYISCVHSWQVIKYRFKTTSLILYQIKSESVNKRRGCVQFFMRSSFSTEENKTYGPDQIDMHW